MAINDKKYWDQFYQDNLIEKPSPFAQFCQENYLTKKYRLLELGSGSGRDLCFFHTVGHQVTGYDTSTEAVNMVTAANPGLDYQNGDFTALTHIESIEAIYSRWTIHSIDDEAAERVLDWVSCELEEGGLFLVEARTVNDGLFGEGTPVGRNAFVTDHYRRFLVVDEFRKEIVDRGFEIIFEKESNGFSVYKGDDPVLLRLVARKI